MMEWVMNDDTGWLSMLTLFLFPYLKGCCLHLSWQGLGGIRQNTPDEGSCC